MATTEANDALVQQVLDGLQAAAASHAEWRTHDPAVRVAYSSLIRAMRERIGTQYKAGKLSAEGAARAASEARNFIMDVSRAVSTPEGRQAAAEMKAGGRTFDGLVEDYARRLYRRPFEELSEEQRTEVFERILKAAGRSNAAVDADMRALGATTRVFWVLTIMMAVWDISAARDKVAAAVHDFAVIGGAILVGEIFGGVMGSFAGPVGTGFGVVVGGVLGGWLVDHFEFDDADPARTGY